MCPLNWGIGHATRMVPVIKELKAQGNDVVIGADGRPLDFLRGAFPGLPFIKFPGFDIRYPLKGSMTQKMALSAPRILLNIYKEHRKIDQLVLAHGFDAVISDNRFGLWTRKAKCIYVTHQLMVKTPWRSNFAEKILRKLNYFFIKKFDHCWIPDLPGEPNLSGDLSHKYKALSNAVYVGPLSRFAGKHTVAEKNEKRYRFLCIVSGPEPQRTVFEERMTSLLKDQPFTSAVLRGIPGRQEKSVSGRVELFSHLDDGEFKKIVSLSETIIARPGYSTLMDLAAMGRNAVVVPTPGQTEQEYLASYHGKKGLFLPVNQDDLNLQDLFKISNKMEQMPDLFDLHLLQTNIKRLFT